MDDIEISVRIDPLAAREIDATSLAARACWWRNEETAGPHKLKISSIPMIHFLSDGRFEPVNFAFLSKV